MGDTSPARVNRTRRRAWIHHGGSCRAAGNSSPTIGPTCGAPEWVDPQGRPHTLKITVRMKSLLTLTAAVSCCVFSATVLGADVDLSKLPLGCIGQGRHVRKRHQAHLRKSCVKCHGAEKQKGKYRLDTLEAALKAGESGDAILKGESAEEPTGPVHCPTGSGCRHAAGMAGATRSRRRRLDWSARGLIRAK